MPSKNKAGACCCGSSECCANQIDLAGAVANGSLSSLMGSIQGPSQAYFLNVSVVDNGGTYTITGGVLSVPDQFKETLMHK